MIISRTPFRISLFGGGSDYPTWYRQYGGAVLGMAIDKYCHISVRRLPPFFEHKHRIVYSRVELVHDIEEIQHPAVRAVLMEKGVRHGVELHHEQDSFHRCTAVRRRGGRDGALRRPPCR